MCGPKNAYQGSDEDDEDAKDDEVDKDDEDNEDQNSVMNECMLEKRQDLARGVSPTTFSWWPIF